MASFGEVDLTTLMQCKYLPWIYMRMMMHWCLIIFPCGKRTLKWINNVCNLQYNVNSIKSPHNDQQSFASILKPKYIVFSSPCHFSKAVHHKYIWFSYWPNNTERIQRVYFAQRIHKFMSLIKLKFVILYLLLQCASTIKWSNDSPK